MVLLLFLYIEVVVFGLYCVFNMVDVFGNIMLDMIYISKKFYEVNLKLLVVFVVVLDEVNVFIVKDKIKVV